ncbi:DNA-directed RNA polymerase III subunit RPC5 [Eumeta japonica]|uniref:DNA-directed RNA polymerase III subunit RPC5 n=1 Tax=Eumeta variegata TaxID=151549 RepID=A0A4C1SUM5_EUMVA|nr:DNA-directed RNA polymerase III subunit RPC5 [Eumeta japonica]
MNHEVKVDFALDTESPFYDRCKGEQLALAADGRTQAKSERPTFKKGIMDKQAFTIVSYFDKEIKRNKAEQKALNEEDDDEELQQVTVKFAKTSGKKVKERQGYDTFVRKSVEEPWCETYWHSRTSPTAELERQKLFATNRQGSHALELETFKYVENYCRRSRSRGIDSVLPARVISKAKLKSMNLMDQLKKILMNSNSKAEKSASASTAVAKTTCSATIPNTSSSDCETESEDIRS